MKFLLASLKTLTNYKDCSENRIRISLAAFLALICLFSPVYCIQYNIAGFMKNFRIAGGFQNYFESHRQLLECRNKLS
jgi:hypothetical protein